MTNPLIRSQATQPSKKIDPNLIVSEVKHGARPGDVYIRKSQPHSRFFRKVGPGHFVVTTESDKPTSILERGYRIAKKSWRVAR